MMAYRNLKVLDKAHTLLLDVNRAVPGIWRPHHQSLKAQLFKSALSVCSNLEEGRHKPSERDFLRFLGIALGSAGELQYQLKVAADCEALPNDQVTDLRERAAEVAKMIRGLIRRIQDDLNGVTDSEA